MSPETDEILQRAVHSAAALYPNASRDDVARAAVDIFKFAIAEADRWAENILANEAWAAQYRAAVDAHLAGCPTYPFIPERFAEAAEEAALDEMARRPA